MYAAKNISQSIRLTIKAKLDKTGRYLKSQQFEFELIKKELYLTLLFASGCGIIYNFAQIYRY